MPDLNALAAAAVAALGAERDSEEFRTSSHRLAQFAAAIGDMTPAHREGRVAVPTFAHIPVMQSMVEVMGRVTGAFALHGEHDYAFHAPIVPGMRLYSRSRLTGVRTNAAGMLLHITSDTATHVGTAVCTQVSTVLLTGKAGPVSAGDAPPERPVPAGGAEVRDSFAISPSLTLAYAEAARDYSAYCLDPEAAAALGFPAPIVHGMLTLSLAASAIVADFAGGEARRLRRLGCRFSQPLYSREGGTLVVTRAMDADGIVAFMATDGAGRVVLTRGYAEVSR
jgi:acyl dehydratase